ncbi:MAG: LytR/AlgR family response regulator transcription factor [Chitinophagales bacterium]
MKKRPGEFARNLKDYELRTGKTVMHNLSQPYLMQDFFFIHDNKQYLQILFSEIEYIEALKKYVKIYTASTPHLVPVSLVYAESRLPSESFCRIHKSYIISLRHAKRFDHEFVFVGGKTVPIGKHYRDILQQKVNIWGRDLRDQVLLSDKTIDNYIDKD